jgi:cyclic-di-GMP-binding protein
MASFDVVSEINLQEVDNAVHQALKEVSSRYDFKGAHFEIDLDKDKSEVNLVSDEESRIQALFDIFASKLHKRGVELGCLEIGKITAIGGSKKKQNLVLKQGLAQETSKLIVKCIKDSKLKVDASIQEKQVRVSAKKIDDLQSVIALLKENQPRLGVPLQFVNMRS